MIDQLFKIIPIYVDTIDNQIRDKKFPDKVEYLKKVRKLNETNVPKIQTSFFEGIRLTYKAKKYQIINNTLLIISVILFFSFFVLKNIDEKYSFEIQTVPLETIVVIFATLSLLLCVLISFGFNAIRSTVYRLFGEIDLYEPKPKPSTTSTINKNKSNGK